ncbi:PH domain-containing protein [Nocardia sp. NPDC057668]|uniref:PH domain-containing protein n=1 Tax=Nocardia sp. NPDC057668 TaxID=3346202 RepID=UPI00366E4649
MTGADPRQKLLPQAPRAAVDHTLAHLLDDTTRVDATRSVRAPVETTVSGRTGSTTASLSKSAAPEHDSNFGATGLGDRSAAGGALPPGGTAPAHAAETTAGSPVADPAHGTFGTQETGGIDSAGTSSGSHATPACGPAREWGELAAPAPVTAELTPHGPAARRRRYTRALSPVGTATGVLLVLSLAGVHIPAWLWALTVLAVPIAIALAWDRYRGLGHAVVPAAHGKPTWLITRSGSLDRDRDCLEAPGIIGWTVRQSWFQRRVGLATITAASAAGKKRYHIIDIPLAEAWPLIEAVTPGQLGSR